MAGDSWYSRRRGGSMAATGTRAPYSDVMKNRRRTTTKTKRRDAPQVSGRRKTSSTNVNTKNALLKRERDELLEQQNATAEVLRVISASPGDLKPVFDALLANAVRLCEAKFGFLYLNEGGAFRIVAAHDVPPAFSEARRRALLHPPPGGPLAELIKSKQTVQVADLAATRVYAERSPPVVDAVELGGIRTQVAVPLLKDNELIGVIGIFRQEVRTFTDKQLTLLTNFADQAVIAIENTRLLNELRQRTTDLSKSLEQQTATSEVLQIISSSPGELQPVFKSMLESAMHICEADFGHLLLYDGECYHAAHLQNLPPSYRDFCERGPLRPSPKLALGQLPHTKQAIHITDIKADPATSERDPLRVAAVELGGARTFLAVPMLNEDQFVGAIVIYRQEVRPFTDKQIELVQNFAAQAVIAIENTRLLNELRQSLQQQTATADVLKVISSSPGELEPVFQAMLENATRICEANFGTLFLRDGDVFRFAAEVGTPPALAEYNRRREALVPTPGGFLEQVMHTKQVSHSADAAAEPAPGASARLGGARSTVCVPMLKDDQLVGVIIIYRQEVRPFTDKQVELVQNFAAQAVIAIENTRLLNELRKSLQQQTATPDVLKVISSSPGELEPVFQAMLENAVNICEATFGNLLLYEGDLFRHVVLHNAPQAWAAERQRDPVPPRHAAHILYRVAETKQVAHIADMAAENPEEPISTIAGARTVLIVPMLKEHALIGAIAIFRQEVRPFTDKQIG